MALKEFLWILPFLCFLVGYFSVHSLYQSKKTETPTLIGKPLPEALALASSKNLNIRLLEEQEDDELPQGTIISQNPSAGTTIKPNQTVFCVSSRKPIYIAPNLISTNHEMALRRVKDQGIHADSYLLESCYPKGVCFAQSPNPQTQLENKSMILYVSSTSSKPIIMPNLKNQLIDDVIEFLKPYNISPSITYNSNPDEQRGTEWIVTAQRPLAGSLVRLDPEKPLQLQLHIALAS